IRQAAPRCVHCTWWHPQHQFVPGGIPNINSFDWLPGKSGRVADSNMGTQSKFS
ncbi:hypothetical protein U1Q18_035833, partial [Sarracenia purpurea var. burkii]